MFIAPDPQNEVDRLAELYACGILDTQAEEAFDALTRVAASICDVPISLVSLVDKKRQWFKASLGLGDVAQTPRDLAFCSHAILKPGVFEVPNALDDRRFHDNPLVTEEPNIRFYAGAPLITSNDFAVGTLCVIDRKPKELTAYQRQMLQELARVAARLIEMRKTDAELRSLGHLLDQSSIEVYGCELDQFKIIESNAQAHETSGYSREELRKLTLPDLLPGGACSDLRDILASINDGQKSYVDVLGHLRRKDGTETPAEIRYQCSLHRGKPALAVFVKDNSALRRAEEEARRNADYARLLIEGSRGHAIIMLDAEGYILSWGPGAERIKLYTAEEAIGKHFSMFYRAEDLAKEAATAKLQRARDEGCFEEEGIRVRKDGSQFVASLVLAPIFDAAGAVCGYSEIVRDITEFRKMQTMLRASEARLSHVNLQLLAAAERREETNRLLAMAEETAHIGHWRVNTITNEVYWSDEIYRIHGVPLGKTPDLEPAFDAYHPDDRSSAVSAFKGAAEEGLSFSFELRLARPDGTIRDVVSIGHAERDPDGRICGVFGVFQDITERKTAERELTKLNERIILANQAGRVGVWEWNIPDDNMVWDRSMRDLYGIESEATDITLETVMGMIHPDDRERVSLYVGQDVSQETAIDNEFRILRRDGEIRHIRASGTVVSDASGKPLRMVGTNWDITEICNLNAQLHEQKERLQVTLYSIGDAVITTDEHARILFINPVAEAILGYTSTEAQGKMLEDVFRLVRDTTGDDIANPVLQCLKDENICFLDEGAVLINRHGKAYDIQDSVAPIRTREGKIVGAVLVFQDVTKARDLQRRLTFNATHDQLTGLCNRTKFEGDCQHALDLVRRSGGSHALCFLDLDRFKIVNDSAGHAAGDMLLREVGAALSQQLRSSDLVARLGGDEFGLLLYDCPIHKAQETCEKIVDIIGAIRLPWEGKFYDIGASAGIVAVNAEAPCLSVLMSQADTACYASKHAGRNQVSIFQPGGSDAAQHQRVILQASQLHQAIETNRFILFAQEIVPASPAPRPQRRLELLVRMLDEEGSLILPGAFIPAAERFGVMTTIDRWVVNQALIGYGEAISRHTDLKISINLSANSLSDPLFLPYLLETIAQSPVCAGAIQFEITETAMISHLAAASKLVAALRDAGCGIALDDFGSGLSSFNYLKHFPVDEIKIDGSFVRNIHANPQDLAIVESINGMAHRLGAQTVAECVEDMTIFDMVASTGVDFAQGYAFARPGSLKSKLIGLDVPPERPAASQSRTLMKTI